MDAKHTPGPWRYERDPEGTGYVAHSHVWGPRVHIETSGNLDYTESDMRLIAAAPELLEAVNICLAAELARQKRLLPNAPATTYTEDRIAKIRAAIAKATGAA